MNMHGDEKSDEGVVPEKRSNNGSLLPAEAGLKLLKQPAKPSWHPLIRISFNGPAYETWRNFLDMAYWDAELKS